MSLMVSIFWLLLHGGCNSPVGDEGVGRDLVAITGVALVDLDAGTIRESVDIVIDDRRIVEIGPGRASDYPSAALIAGGDRFLIPGLYDCHIHLDTESRVELMLPGARNLEFGIEDPFEDLSVYSLNGITTVVALDGSEQMLEMRRRADGGGWTTPRLIVSTPILDGVQSGNPLHLKVSSPADAGSAVETYFEQGYDLVKVYTFLDPKSYEVILTRATELGMPVWGHLPQALTLDEALDGRLAVVAHAEELTRYWDGEDPEFAARVASLLVERRIALIPNLVAYDQILAEIEDLDRLLAEKDWGQVTPLARIYSQVPYNGYVEDFGGTDIRDRALSHFRKQHAMMFEIVREVKKRGGLLVAGSDAGNPTMYPGDGLHRELELLVAAGLSTQEALIAATRSAAEVLGEEALRGRLAPGYEAELVLLDEDPTVDIRATRSVSALYSRGEFVDRGKLEHLASRLTISFDEREQRYRDHLPKN